MGAFFQDFYNLISGIIDLVAHSAESLFFLISAIPGYMAVITQTVAQLPAIFQAAITATVAISVIFLILGRGK